MHGEGVRGGELELDLISMCISLSFLYHSDQERLRQQTEALKKLW